MEDEVAKVLASGRRRLPGRLSKRPEPTAQDFVRMMEALGAYRMGMGPGEEDPWAKVYRMAHVCFGRPLVPELCCGTCSHPDWVREFWKTYDEVKGYWE